MSIHAQCILDYSKYELIWGDEFNYPSNNINQLSQKWLFHYTWQTPDKTNINDGECDRYFWDGANNLFLSSDYNNNGYLNIGSTKFSSPIYIDNIPYYYSSGMIESKYDDCSGGYEPYGFKYGIFEIRCKISPTQSGLSAFWLAGSGGEIDIFESSKDWAQNSRNYFSTTRGTPANNYNICSTFYKWLFSDPADEFHTYSLVWTNDKLSFFIDGNEYRTDLAQSNSFPHNNNQCGTEKMGLIASIHPHCWNANNIGRDNKTSPMVIDYIRVYRPLGYPTSSVPTNYQFPSFKTDDTFRSFNVSELSQSNVHLSQQYGGMTAYRTNNIDRVFFTDNTGRLNYSEGAVANGTSNWQYNGILATNCGVGSSLAADPSSGNVFYKANDNEIWNVYFNGSNWTSTSLDIYNIYPNDVASTSKLVYVSQPRPRVYYVNNAGKLCFFEFNASTSPQWIKYNTQNNATSEIASNHQGSGVFYKGIDNEIWSYYVYNNMTNITSMDINNNYVNNVNKDISCTDNRIYYIDYNNNLWYLEWNVTLNTWIKAQSIVNNIKASPIATLNGGCFYVSTQNEIYSTHTWNGQNVFNKLNFLFSERNIQGNLATSTINRDRIFCINNDGDLNYYEWGDCEILNTPCGANINFGLKQSINNGKNIKDSLDIITIYPNPSHGELFVKCDRPIENVIITDLLGKVVFNSGNRNLFEFKINLNHLTHGLYCVGVSYASGSRITQLITID